jgi:hypothetical protein
MSGRKRSQARDNHDPAFAAIDAMVARADAEFKAVLKLVKPAHRERFLAIVEHTDAYCTNHLEPLHREYETLCRVMAAALCRKGSPVVEGNAKPEGWAAAIVAALGFVNFLSDKEFPPVKTMADVAAGVGVSESGMHAKSTMIRRMLDLSQFDPDWTLPSLLGRNPLVWMLETTSGLIVDVRTRPRAEQAAAFEMGLIPYVPADLAEPHEHERAEARTDPRRVQAPSSSTPAAPSPLSQAGPTLFVAAAPPAMVQPKPTPRADVIGRIGPGTRKEAP